MLNGENRFVTTRNQAVLLSSIRGVSLTPTADKTQKMTKINGVGGVNSGGVFNL